MKKAIITILAVVYLVASNGATVYTHYCMGKAASWNFWPDDNRTCGRCEMEENSGPENGCCEDVYITVKMDEDQKLPVVLHYLVHFSPSTTPIPVTEFLPEGVPSETKTHPPSDALLRSQAIATFLLNCVFRI